MSNKSLSFSKERSNDFLFEIRSLNIPTDLIAILQSEAKKFKDQRIALIGGSVRDYLLHSYFKEPLRGLKDIDILIEGSAYDLAKKIETSLGKERVSIIRVNKA